MFCREFNKSIYLYLFDELDKVEKKACRSHLRRCATCRREMAEVRALLKELKMEPMASPSIEVREDILGFARHEGNRSKGLRGWIADVSAPFLPRPGWLIPAAAAVCLVLLFQVFRVGGPHPGIRGSKMAWQDDFRSEAEWIDREIDRIASGVMLTNYTQAREENQLEADWSEDIDVIRERMDDLEEDLFTI